jgi:hypothetical protein
VNVDVNVWVDVNVTGVYWVVVTVEETKVSVEVKVEDVLIIVS